MTVVLMILTILIFISIAYAIGREHGRHSEKNRCVRLIYQTIHDLKRSSPTVILILNAVLDNKETVEGVTKDQ